MDNLPTTRAEWERAYPIKQPRYLAWCNAARRSPTDFDGPEYSAWIGRKTNAFKGLHGITREFIPPDMDEELTDYLWEL